MSVTYTSQKIKSKTLETITEVIVEGEKLEILTDNQLGIQEIKVINDGEFINTITDGVQLSDYENKIFDAVIQSGIPENLIQLANSLKFQSKVDNADNSSSIQAIVSTIDGKSVLEIALLIENDESQSIEVSFNDSKWNIAVNQDDKNLVKYARILKHKLSATPEKIFSINFEQLLLVSELDKPIMETSLKKIIESYIQYKEFPRYTPDDDEYKRLNRYNRDSWPNSESYLNENENLPYLAITDGLCYKDQESGYYYNEEWRPLTHNPDYDDLDQRRDHRKFYGYSMCEWQADESAIEHDLRNQKNDFIFELANLKNTLKNSFEINSIIDDLPYLSITRLLKILLVIILITKINPFLQRKEYRFGKESRKNCDVYVGVKMIELDLWTVINSQKRDEYLTNIFGKLDAVSGTRLFSSIAQQITDFKDILDNSENLASSEFYQRIYQQTIKSFQNNPEKIEIILADFYKLSQEPIFASSSTIFNTAKTIFINTVKVKSSTISETTIQINSAFPETITGIFIASDEPNTDTQLNIIVTENSQRIINSQNIANYQNKLFQELFSEVVDPDQVLGFINTLKFLTKQSSNNQYTGTLSNNDESYQINYSLIPTHQNQYTLHLQFAQFNWSKLSSV